MEKELVYYEENKELDVRLMIPTINFDMRMYEVESELNNVDYNVEMLSNSSFSNNLFYIAGHSGNGDNCYFNRVRELLVGDYVYIFIGNDKLIYRISDKYFIVKSGYMEISDEVDVIYLITCDIYNSNRQLIVKGILVN